MTSHQMRLGRIATQPDPTSEATLSCVWSPSPWAGLLQQMGCPSWGSSCSILLLRPSNETSDELHRSDKNGYSGQSRPVGSVGSLSLAKPLVLKSQMGSNWAQQQAESTRWPPQADSESPEQFDDRARWPCHPVSKSKPGSRFLEVTNLRVKMRTLSANSIETWHPRLP